MSFRRLTLVAAIIVALGASAIVECFAGPMTPESAMACCAAMDYECHRSGDAQECCKTEVQAPQQLTTPTAPAKLMPPVSATTVVLPAIDVTLRSSAYATALEMLDRAVLRASPERVYVLNASFLI